MSVIQRIRDRGAWIVFGIIALALIAFILQDGVRRGGSSSNTTTLGKVDGDKIDRVDFEQKIAMYGRGQQREQLIGQLWEQEVNSILMQHEFDKLGLVVSDKELNDILYGENSPLKREFTDPQTGVFDVEKAKQAFAQIKKSKNTEQQQGIVEAYLKPAVLQALQAKYQALLQQSLYVPKWMIEKQQADNNLISAVSYVYVPYSSLSDSSFKVSDDEIITYAKKHRKEYENDIESRSIAYVNFDASASAADSSLAVNQLVSLKSEFSSANDMVSFFAKNNTESPFYNGYISKKEIKQKYIDSFVKVPVGGIYGPYVDGSNFVLAKVIGVKQMPDSVKVRHILIATQQPDQATGSLQRVREDSSAKKIIDTVEALIKSGKNFDSVCAKYSDDGNKAKGGVYDYFTAGKMVPSFNDFSFDKPVGSKGVIQTEYGYHYIEILGQKGSGLGYKIAYLTRPIAVSNETDAAANNAAAQFAATSKNKKQFDENAGKIGKQSLPSGEIKENDYSIMGVGESRQLVKWIYEHEAGDVTDQPMRVGDKYLVAIITSVSKPGLASVNILRPMVESIVRNEKKAKQILDNKFKGTTLEAFASSAGVSIQKADSLLFANPFIPGVGNDAKFSGAAFNGAYKGKATEAIAGTGGVFSLRVENISAKPGTDDIQNIKQSILQNERMAIYRGSDALKKAATIKDYRSKFY
jgi:peptidyl-prolyl cis-trans isomerase D